LNKGSYLNSTGHSILHTVPNAWKSTDNLIFY